MKALLLLLMTLAALLPSTARAATSIAARTDSTCAVMTSANSQLYCWGSNSQCQTGINCSNATLYPTPKAGMTSIAQVSKFDYGTCVIQSGAAKCWGDNAYGQTGFNPATHGDTTSARQIPGLTSGVTQISGGARHVCALTSSGAVKCWGDNNHGQLGDGTTTDAFSPVTPIASGAVEVSAGGDTSCAILSTGQLKCWGMRHGNAAPAGDVLTPTAVTAFPSGVSSISLGDAHGCAVHSGAVKCWGEGAAGRLGHGSVISSAVPVQVLGLVSGGVEVSAGWKHTCATDTAGTLRCWGSGSRGQAGALFDQVVPAPIAGVLSTTLISAGTENTCTLSSGTYRCWGDGSDKQNGAGPTAGSWPPDPTAVPFQFFFWGGP